MRTMVVVGIALLGLLGWAAYSNVYASDLDVRARAEKVARDTTDCGACDRRRFEARSSIHRKIYRFTFDKTGVVTVICRRPFIAFGEFRCTRHE